MVLFKILDLCPIALFQQLWNTLYIWNLVSILDSMDSGAVEMEVNYSLKIFAFDVLQ